MAHKVDSIMGIHVIRAVLYVRMSTEHQQYSTENQSDMLREYARKRGIEIVRVFTDAGKSGLRIDGRNGLKELIDLVESGGADFEMILVYDVSRCLKRGHVLGNNVQCDDGAAHDVANWLPSGEEPRWGEEARAPLLADHVSEAVVIGASAGRHGIGIHPARNPPASQTQSEIACVAAAHAKVLDVLMRSSAAVRRCSSR